MFFITIKHKAGPCLEALSTKKMLPLLKSTFFHQRLALEVKKYVRVFFPHQASVFSGEAETKTTVKQHCQNTILSKKGPLTSEEIPPIRAWCVRVVIIETHDVSWNSWTF